MGGTGRLRCGNGGEGVWELVGDVCKEESSRSAV